jgi:uncharacterized membrane protein YidH (DUF202 family)
VLSKGASGLPVAARRLGPAKPGAEAGELIGASIADDLSMTVRYVVGIALVVIGLVSLLWGGFRWTQRKTVLDVGPLKATTEEHKVLPIPPVVGALVLVGGIVVLVVPTRRRV